MSEAKFTPGPWYHGPMPEEPEGTYILAPDGDTASPWVVAEIVWGPDSQGFPDGEEERANAALISSAPDLFDALCKAEMMLEDLYEALGKDAEFINAASGMVAIRTAIAKARGEA